MKPLLARVDSHNPLLPRVKIDGIFHNVDHLIRVRLQRGFVDQFFFFSFVFLEIFVFCGFVVGY